MFSSQSVILFVVVAAVFCGTATSNVCKEDYPGYGCYNGYCCLRCDFPGASFFANGYCWASASNKHLGGDYMPCTDNSQCSYANDRCAAVCKPW